MKVNLYSVSVNASQNLLFPEYCVICGKPADGQKGKIEMNLFQSFFPESITSMFAQASSKQRILNIPSHEICLRTARRSYWMRNILIILIVLFCLMVGEMNSWSRPLEVVLIFVIASPLIYWETSHPLPVEYEMKDNKLIFTFIDRQYADGFAFLNQSEVKVER